MRLHSAMLFVKDLTRMTAFYSDVLGLKPDEATRLDNWVEFRDAAFSLHAIPAASRPGSRSSRRRDRASSRRRS